jgi:coxsackievirus/adenovirus receptor
VFKNAVCEAELNGTVLERAHDGECSKDTVIKTFSRECEFTCIQHEDEVCGTDNVTYWNDCKLDIAACKAKADGIIIERAYYGACSTGYGTESCKVFCPENYDPVCGTDDVTYSNDCHLEKAACKAKADGTFIERAYYGACSTGYGTESCKVFCPENYDPVCGTDDVTYSNDCHLEKAACKAKADGTFIKKAHDEACSSDW